MKQLKLSLVIIFSMLAFVDYKMLSTEAQDMEPSKIPLLTPQPCNPNVPIFYVAVSQSGEYLAARWQNGVRVWHVETGNPVSAFTEDTMQYDDDIAISSDDKYVLTGGQQGVASLWELLTGKKVHSFNLARKIRFVAFLPGDKRILIADINESSVWNIDTKERAKTFSIDKNTNVDTQISSNGKYLVSVYTNAEGSSQSFSAYLWNIDTGEQHHIFENAGTAFFSPKGKYMLTVGDGGYSIWDVQTGKQLHLIDRLDGHRRFYAFSPDENYLYGADIEYRGDSDKDKPLKGDTVIVWDVRTGKQLYRYDVKASPPRVWFFPDSKYLLVGKAFLDVQDWESGEVYSVYDMATGAELYSISIRDSASLATSSLFTPNGKYLVVASATANDIGLKSWDIKTGSFFRRYC